MSSRIMVECRHCPHDAGDDCHRMGIAAEPLEEMAHLLMHHRVHCHPVIEVFELATRRQLAIEQQVANFQIAGVLG